MEALGSYRRGKADSGDCDVLLTHDDGVRSVSLLISAADASAQNHTCV